MACTRAAAVLLSICACAPSTPSLSDAGAGTADAAEVTQETCNGTWLQTVTGQVISEGLALEGARPQLCLRLALDEVLLCLTPPITDAAGHFAIELPPNARCVQRGTFRVFKREYSTPYCAVEFAGTTDGVLNLEAAFRLSPTLPGTVQEEGDTSIASFDSGLRVVFPSGTGSKGLAELRSTPLAPSDLCGSPDLDALYAFSPESPTPPGTSFSVPAPKTWEVGAQADLFVIGGLGTFLRDGTEVAEGALVKFAEGVVTKDRRITPMGDSDLPHLSWLGIRAQ